MSRFASQVLFVARQDVATMLRAKETVLWVFVMPIVFFAFIGEVTGGFGGGGGGERAPDPIALVAPADAGFLVDELGALLEQQGFAVRREEQGSIPREGEPRLVLPEAPGGHASLSAALLAGERAKVGFQSSASGLAAPHERIRAGRALYGLLAAMAVLSKEPEGVTPEGLARLRGAERMLRIEVEPAGRRLQIPSGYEQTIPGTLVMFTMLVLLTSGSILLVIERERGLLARLASTPIPRGALVLGKWAGKMALGLVQIGFAMLAGTLLFRMDWGSSLPAVLLLLLAWAAFNASLGLFLANLARSEGQMAGIGVLCSMVLAALGGCWWPIEITPPFLQRVASFLPTGWTMNAMHALVSFDHGPAAGLAATAALLCLALLLGWAGARAFRYR